MGTSLIMKPYHDSKRSEKTKRWVPDSIKIPKNNYAYFIGGGDRSAIPNFRGGQQRRIHPHGIYHPVSLPVRSLRAPKWRLRLFEENGFQFDLGFSVYQNKHEYLLARVKWDSAPQRHGWVIMSPRREDEVLGYYLHDASAQNYPPQGTGWTAISFPSIQCRDKPILSSETDELLEATSSFRIRLTEGELQL